MKGLHLAYAVALGGTSTNENLEATPLVEDGFMYVVDLWGIVYNIDVRSGDAGRIVWSMNPKQAKAPLSNRGAALWGNFVISAANYPPRIIATEKDTGKVAWETMSRPANCRSPLRLSPLKTKLCLARPAAIAACAISSATRCQDRQGPSGRNTLSRRPASPAARPGRTTTTPGRPAAARCGSPAATMSRHNQVIWGTGNPVPMFDATYRPGDNLYTNSVISWIPTPAR